MENKVGTNIRKLKYGSMAVVTLVFVTAIVVILNVIAGLLTERYPLKIDLTPDKRYELSEETINYLKSFEGDVEISVMLPRETLDSNNYTGIITNILDKYEIYARGGKGSVNVNYYDIDKNPDAVAKYKKYYNGVIDKGSVVIYANQRVRVVDNILSFFVQDSKSQIYTNEQSQLIFSGENTITTAIMSVTDAHPVKLGLLWTAAQGTVNITEEVESVRKPVSIGIQTLEKNGYDVTMLDLSDEFSPEDYDMLMIPASAYDFPEEVIEKINDFLYNGGKYERYLIYIPDPLLLGTNKIDALMERWNVKVESANVSDEGKNAMSVSLMYGKDIAPIAVVPNEDVSAAIVNKGLPVVVPSARPITVLSKNNDVETEVLLQSSPTAKAKPLVEGEGTEVKGIQNFVTVSKRGYAEGYFEYRSKVMVISSAYFTDPILIENISTYNNTNFFLSAVNYMVGKENNALIPQKNLEQQLIQVDQDKVKTLQIFVMYIIPAVTGVFGIVVLLRRKNR